MKIKTQILWCSLFAMSVGPLMAGLTPMVSDIPRSEVFNTRWAEEFRAQATEREARLAAKAATNAAANATANATASLIGQTAYVKASNPGAEDEHGWSVAVSGDTMVVGAPFETGISSGVNGVQTRGTEASGAVYVYVKSGSVWTQQAYLKASNRGVDDQFGKSVAISGNTIVVGAPAEDSSAQGVNGNQANNAAGDAGAAYVFVRSGTVWSQQAYLKGLNTNSYDHFGQSVAVDGETIVVGAYYEASNAKGVNGVQTADNVALSGAAYVFARAGTTWSQQAYLKASNAEMEDSFGTSVAVSGDIVVVGAPEEDSAAPGVNGSQADNSRPVAGAAYVFARVGTAWTQQAYLKSADSSRYPFGSGGDLFGQSVAVSGETIVVGAYREQSSATGVNGDPALNTGYESGAAYVFVRNSSQQWGQQAYLKPANNAAAGFFGYAVAISGDLVVVGDYQDSSNAVGVDGAITYPPAGGTGSASIFRRSGSIWSQAAYLKASNPGTNTNFDDFFDDLFGYSVAISGDQAVVGAIGEDSAAIGVNGNQLDNSKLNAGAAYVFGGLGLPAATIPLEISSTRKDGPDFTIDFKSTAGLVGWTMKGSADLASFPADLTSVTTFTEPSPGVYRAVVNLSGLPGSRYFMRIER